ncbi:MBL fold metallo-hydrolase [uncultured Dysosmobacter sp.]|uniref:MBL fold metallo-hydrolase n=1 Tax=uncultured Dysosmobacter sp. TaxID=2591384 RepID=UPI00262A3772|nr:MBL fold metallo-hydrolase [uncultured Dysosmobacter sp.]
MYELIQTAPRTYYILCPAKMGIWKLNDTDVVLIDSGSDKDAGRKVQKLLDAQGWTLKAILNTHANADHNGGNALLQQRLGAPAFAPGIDAAITSHPILEPAFLYGGYPCKALRNKFLLAQPSDCRPLTAENLPDGLTMLPLPGHFFDMCGFQTADGVWFLADCLSGANIVEKYHVNFIYDVAAYLDTLDKVCALEGKMFIPAHAEPTDDIRPLAKLNRAKVLEITSLLLDLCREPLCFEDVLQRVFQHYQLTIDFNQYVLVGSTIRSYLSYLLDQNALAAEFSDSRLLWRTV